MLISHRRTGSDTVGLAPDGRAGWCSGTTRDALVGLGAGEHLDAIPRDRVERDRKLGRGAPFGRSRPRPSFVCNGQHSRPGRRRVAPDADEAHAARRRWSDGFGNLVGPAMPMVRVASSASRATAAMVHRVSARPSDAIVRMCSGRGLDLPAVGGCRHLRRRSFVVGGRQERRVDLVLAAALGGEFAACSNGSHIRLAACSASCVAVRCSTLASSSRVSRV